MDDINLLIAKKVMNLNVVKNKSGAKSGGYYYTVGEPVWFDMSGSMELQNYIPDYKDDIVAAMTIVDYIGGTVTLTTNHPHYPTTPETEWYCSFDGGDTYADGESAAHAICLAALKFKGLL